MIPKIHEKNNTLDTSLFLQIYEIIDPTHGLMRHYIECHDVGRLHVPAVLLIAGNS